jgi:predicted O-methyltransferase YrrM
MTPETWTAVDHYVNSLLIPPDPGLDGAVRASTDAKLPPIAVSAAQGKLLHLLARIHGSRRILEIGTLGGYSTIWLARALPADGQLISLEFDPHHADVARKNVASAGVSAKVDIRVGRAIDLLPGLESGDPFDFVFVDADKPSTPDYFRWAMKLTRKGGIIVVDNVVRAGEIVDASSRDENIAGMRQFLDVLARERGADATVIQTVGAKGYDGFALIVV